MDSKPRKRRRWPYVALAVVVALPLAAVVAWQFRPADRVLAYLPEGPGGEPDVIFRFSRDVWDSADFGGIGIDTLPIAGDVSTVELYDDDRACAVIERLSKL